MAGFSKPTRQQKTFNREKDLRQQKRRAKKNRGRYTLEELRDAFNSTAPLHRRSLGG